MSEAIDDSPERRHLVRSFDSDLQQLSTLILRMGGMVEQQVAHSLQALSGRDETASQHVIERDVEVDSLEEEIDQLAIKLLATRQPMAIDLRVISMALKLSNDLERISDYARNIARRAIRVADEPRLRPLITIPKMGQAVQLMVKDILDAYIERDVDKAMDVWQRDEEVDAYYDSLFRELITFILEDPRKTTTCIDLLFIAKNLERIGDHTTNIAEKIHYMVHGIEINRSRKADA